MERRQNHPISQIVVDFSSTLDILFAETLPNDLSSSIMYLISNYPVAIVALDHLSFPTVTMESQCDGK